MPYFVKYCPEQFNIVKGCTTLQVNNFLNLQEGEIREGIKDSTEAVSHWQSRPSGGDEPMVMQDAEVHNCFVFSICRYEANELIDESLFEKEGYDSFYVIRDLSSFIGHLLFNLRLYVRLKDLDDNVLKELSLNAARTLQVDVLYHGLVNYLNNETGKHEEPIGHPRVFDKNWLINTIMTKHSDFTYQREYRIVFVVGFTNVDQRRGIFPVSKTPVILPLNPIVDMAKLSRKDAYGMKDESATIIGDDY